MNAASESLPCVCAMCSRSRLRDFRLFSLFTRGSQRNGFDINYECRVMPNITAAVICQQFFSVENVCRRRKKRKEKLILMKGGRVECLAAPKPQKLERVRN